MQKWIIENNFEDKLSGVETPNSLTIYVFIINELCQGLQSDIVGIANWENTLGIPGKHAPEYPKYSNIFENLM